MTNKHFFFLLILISSFLSWEASAQNDLLKDAQRLVNTENLDSAVIKYEALVQAQSQNKSYKQALLDLYFVTNRPSKGANICESLLKSPEYAQNIIFHYGYIDLLMMSGEYSKARKHLLSIKDANWVSAQPMRRAGIEARIERIDFAENNKDKTPAFVVKNQKAVNSKYPDFAPQFIQNKVYFESKRPVVNPSGFGGITNTNLGFPYKAERVGNIALSTPSTVIPTQSPKFSHNANLAPFSYSKESDFCFLGQNSFPAGIRHPIRLNKGSGLRLGYFKNKDLDNLPNAGPDGIPQDFEHAAESSGFPCLADGGKTLYFASTSKFAGINYGGYDIFVSYYKNGNWTSPRNLGTKVNSPGNELSPFVDANGILYFSSDALAGFGGFDVYRSQRTTDGWGAVRNMGPSINSSQDDLYFVFDSGSKIGYFTSNRKGGMGDYDIYSARFTGTVEMMPALFTEDEVIADIDPKPQPDPDPNANPATNDDNTNGANNGDPDDNGSYVENDNNKPLYDPDQIEKDKEKYNNNNTNNDPYSKKIPCADNAYIGVILDAVTQRPVEGAWVYVQNMKNGVKFKKLTSKYGEYAVILEPQTQYEVLCSREGYQNLREEVYTGDGQKHTLLGQLSMNPSATNISDDNFANRGGTTNNKVVNEEFVRATVANKAIPQEGYMVQIGVFKNLPLTLRSELEQHANILSEPHKSMDANVYRLGIFAEKAHADKVLAKVRTMKDFKGAFMKTENLSNVTSAERMSNGTMVIFPLGTKKEDIAKDDDPVKNNIYGDPEKNMIKDEWAEMPRGGANNDVVVVENPRDNYADNPNLDGTTGRGGSTVRPLEYKVQIGAYKKPESANFPDLSHVGKLEKRINSSNGLTYFFVTGYTNLDDARKARVRVESSGVKSAFIVAFKNGNRVPLTDAVN